MMSRDLNSLDDEDFASGELLSDEELAALALADDVHDAPVEQPTRSISHYVTQASSTLPAWYMPAVGSISCRGWRRPLIYGVVATLLVIEALGLCSAFGQVVIG